MSAGRGRGRGRIKYASLRKPGENLQQTEVESEEKPPVQTTVGLIEDRQEQVARSLYL